MAQTVGFWIRRKYNLLPNDPRFLALTPLEIRTEYWAHFYADNPNQGDEFEDDDFDLDSIIAEMSRDDDDDQWEEVDLDG